MMQEKVDDANNCRTKYFRKERKGDRMKERDTVTQKKQSKRDTWADRKIGHRGK